jgi:predicted phage terminase large subunit-like protein
MVSMYAARVAAERSLLSFTRLFWHVIERGRPFQENWHHRVICQHLEAVTRGLIPRLAINVPPRSTKSTLVGVMWPAWTWVQTHGGAQFLTGSHRDTLAVRDALKTRRIIESPMFTLMWGDRVKLRPDQNQKTRYELEGGGHRITFGMGSGVTGEGGDFLVIDDPHPAKEGMWSEANREAVREMYDQELFTRLNDPDKSAIVIIMQRLHVADLTGHVLGEAPKQEESVEVEPGLQVDDKHEWDHLRLPMEFEPGDACQTSLGLVDPRTEPGELLQPGRFSAAWVRKAKKTLGTYGIAGQLQQRPAPLEGGIIDMSWFRRYHVLPKREEWLEVVQFWDTAQKPDEVVNAPWVCGTWVRTERGLYLKNVYRRWMTYPDGKRAVKSLYVREQPSVVVVEDASTGQSIIQEFREDSTVPVRGMSPEQDKLTRLSVESPMIEAGHVYLPHTAPWLPDFEQEISTFPASATKDQADMLSMALKYFREGSHKTQFLKVFDF